MIFDTKPTSEKIATLTMLDKGGFLQVVSKLEVY